MAVKEKLLKRVMGTVGAVHAALYRRTGGRVGRRFRGGSVLLLTVRGRTSGRPFTSPLMYVRDGEAYVVAASNGGIDREPSWWLNLLADPRAEIQVDDEVLAVTAERASAEERPRLWRMLNAMYSGYDGYQAGVSREIAVVVLRPIGAG